MANLTEQQALTLDKLIKRLAQSFGFTENAIVADVGTQIYEAVSTTNGGEISTTYGDAGSFQALAADLELEAAAGSADGSDPDFIGAIMGNLLGADLTKDANYLGGVIGHYSVTGVKASTYPAGAVLGGIGDGVTQADGAFVAYIDGDSALTRAGAAFKVRNNNSVPGSGLDFGLDLQDAAHDGFAAVNAAFYSKAPVRIVSDVVILVGAGVPVDGTTGDNVAGPGSMYIDTTNAEAYLQTSLITTPVWKKITRAA